MKKIIFFAVLCVGCAVENARAAVSCTLTPSCSGVVEYDRIGTFCATYVEAGGYYKLTGEKVCIMECGSCPSSTTKTTQNVTMDAAHFEDFGCDTVYIDTCVPREECWAGTYGTVNTETNPPIFSCQSCPSGATSPDGATDVTQCVCQRGYWGTISGIADTCTRCPAMDGMYGTTADVGATSISECYIAAGTIGRDDTGALTYTQNCYYTE